MVVLVDDHLSWVCESKSASYKGLSEKPGKIAGAMRSRFDLWDLFLASVKETWAAASRELRSKCRLWGDLKS